MCCEPFADEVELVGAVVDCAANGVVGVCVLEIAHEFELVNGGHAVGEDGVGREAARKRDDFGGGVCRAVEAEVGLDGVAAVLAERDEGVAGVDADAAEHVATVGGVDARGDARKEGEGARGLDGGELDGNGEPVLQRVVAVVLAERVVEGGQPGALAFVGLQHACDADALPAEQACFVFFACDSTVQHVVLKKGRERARRGAYHAHVCMHDALRRVVVALERQRVLADAVEGRADAQQLGF